MQAESDSAHGKSLFIISRYHEQSPIGNHALKAGAKRNRSGPARSDFLPETVSVALPNRLPESRPFP
jgi:hypothetical protein